MATEIRVPTLGESVTEATIGRWFKHAGDAVAADEPLVELETDKVTIEVPAPTAGVLAEILVKEGAAPAKSAPAAKADAPAAPPPKADAPKPAPAPPAPLAAAPTAAPKGGDMPLAPSVRRLAAESGIDVGTVTPTGKDGRLTKGDMLNAIERAAAAPTPVAQSSSTIMARAPSAPDDAAREERVRMTKLRQTIARRLKDAQNTAAMLTTFNEVDMTQVM